MPIDIYGWVEICRHPDIREEDCGWSAVIDISPLVEVADEVSDTLFGISKSPGSVMPLAYCRGLPPQPSTTVREDAEDIERFIARHGPGEFLGISYIGYEEILASGISTAGSGWALVFQLIEQIKAFDNFGHAEFRIVCWAFW